MKAITVFLLFLLSSLLGDLYQPTAVYLTWKRDPSTTMHLSWVTLPDRESNDIEYRKLGDTDWLQDLGSSLKMPLGMPYLIHHLELTHLLPNTDYEFRPGSDASSYYFRTLPSDSNATFSFIVGGDLYCGTGKGFTKMNSVASSLNPQFVVLGGDIAYAHEKVVSRKEKDEKLKRWVEFLKIWTNEMVTPDGRLIPFLPAIGNHDVSGHFDQNPEKSPFFYALFPFPGSQGYQVLDIADTISLIILDSGHCHAVGGEQTEWLEQTLKSRGNIPHKLAIYHVPAYPGRRDINTPLSAVVRNHWVPIFDQFGLNVAFEHHDHTYKRTHPLAIPTN